MSDEPPLFYEVITLSVFAVFSIIIKNKRGFVRNRIVYILAFLLIVLSLGLMKWKVAQGEKSVEHDRAAHLWRVSIVMNLTGNGNAARARLTLPEEDDRQVIYNEHSEACEDIVTVSDQPST